MVFMASHPFIHPLSAMGRETWPHTWRCLLSSQLLCTRLQTAQVKAWLSQQNCIISKEQRDNSEVPRPDNLPLQAAIYEDLVKKLLNVLPVIAASFIGANKMKSIFQAVFDLFIF